MGEWPEMGVDGCHQEELVYKASPNAFAGCTSATGFHQPVRG